MSMALSMNKKIAMGIRSDVTMMSITMMMDINRIQNNEDEDGHEHKHDHEHEQKDGDDEKQSYKPHHRCEQ